jgi:hypothetical protein
MVQYYDLATSVAKPSPQKLAFGAEELVEGLAKFEKIVDWRTNPEPRYLDTIAYANSVLKRQIAIEVANRTISLLWQPNSTRYIEPSTKVRMTTRLSNIRDGRPPSDGIIQRAGD